MSIGLALLIPAAASAETVTIGETTLASVGPALSSLSPEFAPVFQGDATAGYVLSSPQTGTVTSFSFMSAGERRERTMSWRSCGPRKCQETGHWSR